MNWQQLRTVLAIVGGFVVVKIVLGLDSPWRERAEVVLLVLLPGLAWSGVRLLQASLALAGVGFAVYLAATLPEGAEAGLARVLAALPCLSLALLLGMAAFGGVRFTERGVFGPSSYVAWADVAAYHWVGRALTLVPRRQLPFFAPMPWEVPADQKDAVEAVLARHVAPAGTAATSA